MPSLVAIGDVHFGRTSARLELALADGGMLPGTLGPTEAWRAAVDLALRGRPDAVLYTGGIVEGERDRFEAYRALEAAVHRLIDTGIAALHVAGNHDAQAFPRRAARLPAIRLPGVVEWWELAEVEGAGVLGRGSGRRSKGPVQCV